jgi:hypothetical protein
MKRVDWTKVEFFALLTLVALAMASSIAAAIYGWFR